MKYLFSIIAILTLFILSSSSLNAQKDGRVMVTNTDATSVKIKWINQTIYTSEDVMVYRQEGNGKWQTLTSTPIGMKDQVDMPAIEKDELTSFLETELPKKKPEELDGFMKLIISKKLVTEEAFADFLGVFYEDKTVTAGKKYRYKVMVQKGNKEEQIGISEAIKVKAHQSITGVKDFVISTEAESDTLLRFVWLPESARYFACNLYRSEAGGAFKKLNDTPILSSGKKGNYSKQFFQYGDQKAGRTYTFEIRPIDFFGREGKPVTKKITMPDTEAPAPATSVEIIRVNEQKFRVLWANSTSANVKGYEIHVGRSVDQPFKKVSGLINSPSNEGFVYETKAPGSYFVKVVTVAANGSTSESYAYGVEMNDLQGPEIPQGIKAEAKSGKITISWKANKESDLLGYRVFRTIASQPDKPAAQITPDEIKGTSFTDNLNKRYKNEFFYTVVAVDTSLNISKESERVGAIMPDVIPPIPPFIKDIKVSETSVQLTWLPGTDEDLKFYQLFRSLEKDGAWKKVGGELNATATNYTDKKLTTGQQYYYRLQAFDQTGNASEFSEIYAAKPWAVAKNAELSSFELKYDKKSKGVKLSWKPTNTKNIKGAIVMRSNGFKKPSPASPMITGNSYLDTKVSQDQNYQYSVKVYYENGEVATSALKAVSTE